MRFPAIIAILFAAAAWSSCSKVLDKNNLETVSESDSIWNNLDLSTAFVNRIYVENLPVWTTEFADYSDESDGGGSYMYGQLTENSVNYWPYDDIRDINTLLTKIDKGTLAPAQKTYLKAQAYFFRAWQYFELVKRYGGVPLILKPQALDDPELFVKRTATSLCMKQIISDLDSAIAGLPAVSFSSADNNGRVHKGTAMAVKGRILMFWASPQFDPSQSAAGRWEAAYQANKAAKDTLDSKGFGLYPSFGNLWLAEMNREVIFVKRYQYVSANSESWNNWAASTRPLDISQGITGGNRPVLEIMNLFPMKDGKAINDPSGAYPFDASYYWKNRDPRFAQTFVWNGTLWEVGSNGVEPGRIQWTYAGSESNGPTVTGYYMRKAVDTNQSSIQAFNSGTDWIELRYAELLLNLAEAANETNRTLEAYPLLTAIRARAGIEPGADNLYGLKAGMSQAEMRKAIVLERAIELAYEAKRFWDLRRLRLFESTLNGKRRHGHDVTLKVSKEAWENIRKSMTPQQLVEFLQTNYTTYFQQKEKLADTQFDIAWKELYYFFAIPQEHLQLNSNLQQTNGWAGGSFDPLQ